MQNNSTDLHSPQEKADVDVFFSGAQRRKTVEDIKRVLTEGAQIITVSGDEGSGKTMVCRMVEKELSKNYSCVYLADTLESFEGVLRALVSELGVEGSDPSLSSSELISKISTVLRERNHRLLVIFDQQEMMYLATIERIWKLLIAVNSDEIFLQVILVGKESMLENLKQLTVCNFKYEEDFNFKLNALGLSETYAYLNHCAQRHSPIIKDKNLFTPEAAKKIYSIAKGNFRMTTMFMEKTLNNLDPESSFMMLLDQLVVEDTEEEVEEKKGFAPLPFLKQRLPYIGIGIVAVVAFVIFFIGEDEPPVLEKKSGVSEVNQVTEKEPSLAKNKTEVVRKKITLTEKREGAGNIKKEIKVDSRQKSTTLEKSSMLAEDNGSNVTNQDTSSESKTPVVVRKTEETEKKAVISSQQQTNQEKVAEKVQKEASEEEVAESSVVEIYLDETGGATSDEPVVSRKDIEKDDENKQGDVKAEGQIQEVVLLTPVRRKVKKELAVADSNSEKQEVPDVTAGAADSELETGQKKDMQIAVAPLAVQKEQEEESETNIASVPEEKVEEEKIVILSDTKKREPERRTGEVDSSSGKIVQKIGPPKLLTENPENVSTNNSVGENLYKQRVEQGSKWLTGEMDSKFTVQLMMLSDDHGEENLIQKFNDNAYQEISDSLFVIKNSFSKLFVFYGIYPDIESARRAKKDLPSFLRVGDPYVVAISEAVAGAIE